MFAGELNQLRRDALRSKRAAFAEGTVKNLMWQWRLFIMFCIFFKFKLLPATVECLCLYAQFLSRSMQATDTIRNYLSGVRTLHVLCDVTYLGKESIELKLMLRGLSRRNPHMVKQAAPLSPNILFRLAATLDLNKPLDVTMWSLMLLAFFTMSRKSNLVVTGKKKFDAKKQLCRSDVQVGAQGLLVTFKWSKTNQFGKRAHVVPIPAIPNSVLCPVYAYKEMLSMCPGEPGDPAFFIAGTRSKQPVTYQLLQK